jgi:YNFM family putative membrane transporter
LAAPPFQFNSAQLGSIFFVYLLGLIVTPASGLVLDRAGYLPTCVMALAMSACGLLLTLPRVLPSIIVGLALFSSGVFVLQAAATAQTGVVAGKARSTAAGMYLTFYYTGGTLGAVLPAFVWARMAVARMRRAHFRGAGSCVRAGLGEFAGTRG